MCTSKRKRYEAWRRRLHWRWNRQCPRSRNAHRIGRGNVLEGKIPGACCPRGLDYAGGGLEVKSLKSNPTAAHGAGAMKFQSLAQGPVASVKPIALAGAAT